MQRLFKALQPVIQGVVRRPGGVLVLACMVTLVAAFTARKLAVDPDFANLIPQEYPSVQALERVRALVGGGETSVDLAIESPSFEANVAFAEALVPRALELRRDAEAYFVRAELRRDTEFLEDNGLYFATWEELDDLQVLLEDMIVEAKKEANPFFFDFDDEEEQEPDTGAELRTSLESVVGSEYLVSPDSTILVVRFFAGGPATNVAYIEALYDDVAGLIADMRPADWHVDMKTALAGRLWRQRVEVRAITDDVLNSLGVGLLFVLLTVVSYFFWKSRRGGGKRGFRTLLVAAGHALVSAFVIGLPLAMSLIWTAAVAYLAFGTLNLLSSTLGLVLFGLGIDYGIHFLARYIEERRRGEDAESAAERTFRSTGQAIATGAFTTAAPLFILLAADFRGFSEFGAIAGTGVLFALAATVLVTPALLTVCDRTGLLRLQEGTTPRGVVQKQFPGARAILACSLAAVLLVILMGRQVRFEYRFDHLEPEYPEWERVATTVAQAYNTEGRRNPAYVVVDDPNDVPAVVAAILRKSALDTTLHVVEADSFQSTVRSVESFQERFPTTEEVARRKIATIAYIRDTLLTDPFIQAEASDDLRRLERAAGTTQPITVDEVPDFLAGRFTSKTGEIGRFISIFPSVGLSDGRKSIAFADEVGTIVTEDGTYHAGSTSIVAADMLVLMQKEAPLMVLATVVLVALLLLVNFGRLRWAMLAMLPLVVGVLWMLLVMGVFGIRLNFYNLSVLPAIIGIGNDAGAHMVHRYREEGAGSIVRVLRSTGEHVTVGALTTMVGFSGLLLSFHPGLQTIGMLAVVGISTTLVAALGFLPALVQWIENRRSR